MNPILTTITPYWGRPKALRVWVDCLKGASVPEVRHIIFFVGELAPDWWEKETAGLNILSTVCGEKPGRSIGYYHNRGAAYAETDWIMKLDVDCLPHVGYWKHLVQVLRNSGIRHGWYNGGMFYLSRHYGTILPHGSPLPTHIYTRLMENRATYSASSYLLPAATNFICLRQDYIGQGGCKEEFRGYGWEDYQQIYMLERLERGFDPLPGPVTLANVTQRCRDEISRPKARQLWEIDPHLCLIHQWHPTSSDPEYRGHMEHNRRVLFDYVMEAKRGDKEV